MTNNDSCFILFFPQNVLCINRQHPLRLKHITDKTHIYKHNIQSEAASHYNTTTTQHNTAQWRRCRTDPVVCTGTGGERHVTPARSASRGPWGAGLPDAGGLPCAPSVACGGGAAQGVACQGDAAHPPRTGRRTWPGWVALGAGP